MADFSKKSAFDKKTTAKTNSRRVTNYEIKNSNCIDYFKFRVNNIIEVPNSSNDYENFSKNGNEPGLEDYTFISELCRILILKPFEFYKKEKIGYPKFYVFDEDVYIYGGKASEESIDGIPRFYLEMKGHALRQFELRCIENNLDVFEQYCKLFDFCYKYSLSSNDRNLKMLRIDVARDDFTNYIKEKEIRDKLEKGFYVTRSTKIQQSLNYFKDENIDEVNEIISKGWTCYIGGRTSRQLCIYNKAEERKSKDKLVLNDHWMRYEARFYQENAFVAFSILYFNVFRDRNVNLFNDYVGKLINCIVEFKEDNNYSKESQYQVDTWYKWYKFFGDNDLEFKIQASVESDNTMLKSKDWLIKSPYMNITLQFLTDVRIHYNESGLIFMDTESPSKIYEMVGVPFNDYFIKFIFALLKRGKEKLDAQKLAKVNNLRKAKGFQYIKTVDNAKRILDFYVNNHDDYGFLSTNVFQEELNV